MQHPCTCDGGSGEHKYVCITISPFHDPDGLKISGCIHAGVIGVFDLDTSYTLCITMFMYSMLNCK